MDYYEIGQRIRKIRKENGISQEELAEKIGISTTHMSHIETANTKLSLQVLTDISKNLNISTDYLIFGKIENKKTAVKNIELILDSCSENEILIISDIIKSIKFSLDKYLK